jgi:hypothetical protein
MYKLTVEFKNNEELAAFVVKLGGLPAQAALTQTVPVKVEQAPAEIVEEKPKKAKPVKKETVVDQGAEVEVPPVIPTPAAKPTIDRAGAIATITAAIQDLTASGMKGPALAKHLGDLYIQADCPAGTKIGQLDDEQLSRFFPAFTGFVAGIKGQTIVQPEQASFV